HNIHVWHSRAVPFEVSAGRVVVGGKDEKCQAGGVQYPEAFGQTPFRILDVLKYIVGQNQVDRFASQREGLPESGYEGNGAWRNGIGRAGCGRNDSRIYFETYHMARNGLSKLDCPAAEPASQVESQSSRGQFKLFKEPEKACCSFIFNLLFGTSKRSFRSDLIDGLILIGWISGQKTQHRLCHFDEKFAHGRSCRVIGCLGWLQVASCRLKVEG